MHLLETPPTRQDSVRAVRKAIAAREGFRLWPAPLRRAFLRDQKVRTVRELRFLLGVALTVAIVSALLDALFLPELAVRGMVLRTVLVLLPGVALFSMAKQISLPWLKLGVASTIIAFGAIVVHLASYADPATATRYTMASTLLLGMAILLLPFLREEKLGFAVGYTAAVFGTAIWPRPVAPLVMAEHVFVTLLVCAATLAIAYRHIAQQDRTFLYDKRDSYNQAELEANIRVLRELSERDALTGLSNRRSFVDMFAHTFGEGVMSETREVTVMMIDLDNFKQFNDRYGHQAGDRALRAVGKCLETIFAGLDGFVARFGGEEFIAAIYSRSVAEAVAVGEEIRQAIAELEIEVRCDGDQQMTTSIGIASTGPNTIADLGGLIERADRALYEAKREGRNRVVASERIELRIDRLAI